LGYRLQKLYLHSASKIIFLVINDSLRVVSLIILLLLFSYAFFILTAITFNKVARFLTFSIAISTLVRWAVIRESNIFLLR